MACGLLYRKPLKHFRVEQTCFTGDARLKMLQYTKLSMRGQNNTVFFKKPILEILLCCLVLPVTELLLPILLSHNITNYSSSSFIFDSTCLSYNIDKNGKTVSDTVGRPAIHPYFLLFLGLLKTTALKCLFWGILSCLPIH